MKAGALFDMDGLLFDTERVYNRAWNEIAYEHGLRIHPEMLDELRGTNGSFMCAIVNRYWLDVKAEYLIEEVFDKAKKALENNVPIKRGAIELLSFFQQNHVRLAVASSAPMALIKKNLKVSGLDSYFDVVVSGEQVTHGKPAGDIYVLAAEKLHLRAQDCYVFEDGIHGVYAGIHAGCKTYMIPDLIPPTDEVLAACAGVYPSLCDILHELQTRKE